MIEATFSENTGEPARFVLYGVEPVDTTASFTGLVLNNAGQPIIGAKAVLEIGTRILPAVFTNAKGTFSFSNIPAGAGHLRVDGLVATASGGESVEPGSFPALSYEIVIVRGAQNTLPRPVLLPGLDPDNARIYDGSKDVELTAKGIDGLKMTVRTGSMTNADGSIPDLDNPAIIALNPVHRDDIPMPMPNGASPPFAWTLQPSRATFNPPVEIIYPNMSCLPAGSIGYFLSFNHGTNRFGIVASAHVTNDGAYLISDRGAGISTAGWGSNCPPYTTTGGAENSCDEVAPSIECPEEMVICINPDQTEVTVDFDVPVATHSCNTQAVTVSCNPESGSTFSVGEHMVTCTAKDVNNNTSTCKFNVNVVKIEIVPDWNRDGVINDDDRGQVSATNPWRFWVNDDDDEGDSQITTERDLPGNNKGDASNSRIDGILDLIDFFPLYLNFADLVEILPANDYAYAFHQDSGALNFAYTNLAPDRAGDIHSRMMNTGFGPLFDNSPGEAITQQITAAGVELNSAFLSRIRDQGQGVILLEGRGSTTSPLQLVITHIETGVPVVTADYHLSICPIRDMLRIVNIREADPKFSGSGAGPWISDTSEPSNYPDGYYRSTTIGGNIKTLVNIHGFDWSEDEIPAGHSEVFKRFFQAGSNARFIGVSWRSDEGPLGVAAFDYNENVINAFVSARYLTDELLNFDGPNTSIFAHSLGNMITSSRTFTPKSRNELFFNDLVFLFGHYKLHSKIY